MKHEEDIALNGEELNIFLNKYFSYYRTLDVPLKVLFVRRLLDFIHSKTFISQKELKINNGVKAIVSASAVQLTLGLENWKINYFETIILFPSEFKNELSGLTLKGETNLSGYVSLSWKNFIEGYRIPDDNLNLGLHEFTHALRFNGVRGHENDEFFCGYFPKWYAFAYKEFRKLKNGEESIFRKYGGVNINEFLSVVIEHFFESPEEFHDHHPHFYSATAILLNQRTDGKKTKINIRREELEKLNAQLKLFPSFNFENKFQFFTTSLCLAITLYTITKAGLPSFAGLFMTLLTLLLYLRADFMQTCFSVENDKILLTRGFLFFKNREVISISASQIVKAEFETYAGGKTSVELTFFADGDFYEETAYLKRSDSEENGLKEQLQKLYVWVK